MSLGSLSDALPAIEICVGKDGLLSKVPTLAKRHGGLLERGVE
jgi:hypothetical protein